MNKHFNNFLATKNKNYAKRYEISQINEVLVITLVFLVSFFPMVLYSKFGLHDPFLNNHIAYLVRVSNDTNIDFSSGILRYIPGYGIMLISLSKICGISLEIIEFLPLCGPIFIFSSYALAKRLLSSPITASLFTILVVYGYALPYYSVWPHGFGFFLYLLFILIYFLIFDGKNKVILISLLTIIFIAIHLYSYTAEIWVIPLLIFVYIFLAILAFLKRERLNKHLNINILLSFIVIMLTFNKLFYDSLSILNITMLTESFQLFIGHWGGFLGLNVGNEKYIYKSLASPILSWVNFSYLVCLIIPVISYVILFVKDIFQKNVSKLTNLNCLGMAMALVLITDISAYALSGVLFLRYIFFIYPLLVLIALKQASIRNSIKTIFLLSLLILCITSFCLNYSLDLSITSSSKYDEFEPSANWYFEKVFPYNLPLTDHYTGGRYDIVAAHRDESFMQFFYNQNIYEYLVDNEYISKENAFFENRNVIINKKFGDKKTWSGGWHDFEPLKNYFEEINTNINIKKIYDDGIVWIFVPS